jgi:hypothetical protein
MAKKYSTDRSLQGLWEEGILMLPEYPFLVLTSFFFFFFSCLILMSHVTQMQAGHRSTVTVKQGLLRKKGALKF